MQPLLSGAHAPNSPLTERDVDLINIGGFKACKLLTYHHTPVDVMQLRARTHVRRFMFRTADSIQPELDAQGRDTGRRYILHWTKYVAQLEKQLAPLIMAAPDAEVVIDNEPNVPRQWPSIWFANDKEPGGGHWGGAGDWRAWMQDVLNYLLPRYPDIRWTYTGMSWTQPGAAAWMHSDLINRLKRIAVHSYWQSTRDDGPQGSNPSPMFQLNFGANAVDIHNRFPGHELIIGEYANSLTDRRGTPQAVPQSVIWEAMKRQYPKYLRWVASERYVSAAYLFIVGGTADWAGFQPNLDVLAAVANYR